MLILAVKGINVCVAYTQLELKKARVNVPVSLPCVRKG